MTGPPKGLLRLICNTLEPVNPSINVGGEDYTVLNSWSSSLVPSVRYLLHDDTLSTIQGSEVNICDTVIGSAVSTNLLVCAPSVDDGTDQGAGK